LLAEETMFMFKTTDADLEPRSGSPSARRPEGKIKRRFMSQCRDAAHQKLSLELAKVFDAARDADKHVAAGSAIIPAWER